MIRSPQPVPAEHLPVTENGTPADNRLAPKRLALLGSTGSIGVQALEVAVSLGWPVAALTACRNVARMEEQVRHFRPALAVMTDEAAAADLRVRVRDLPVRVESGAQGLCEAAAADVDMVLNAVVGVAGLLPTLTAIEAGRDVALANKETLVAGGAPITQAATCHGVRLLPVDSEHSAIFQSLQGAPRVRDGDRYAAAPAGEHHGLVPGGWEHGAVRKLILTASGGPFFGFTAAELAAITPAQALRHPNWSMGAKITIDSATMINKGLELMEACWLFGVTPEQVEVVIHRESIVHSLVEYADHAVVAQLGVPDMRIPIQYALTFPSRMPSPVRRLELAEWGKLTFFAPDDAVFPAVGLCREAHRRGGLAPAAVNAANEQAVALFLDGRIGFPDIVRLAQRALEWAPASSGFAADVSETTTPRRAVEDILALDGEIRRRVRDEAGVR